MDNTAKSKSGFLILLGILLTCGVLFYLGTYQDIHLFAVTGAETISRTLPSSVGKGETFSVTWTIQGASGVYGFLIEDTLSGGCRFSDGSTTFVGLINNPDTTKSLTVLAPTTVGRCTFTGIYNIGNLSQKSFTTQNVDIICRGIAGDTNCDGIIRKSELLTALQGYINNTFSKLDLLNLLQAWIDGGGQ